VSRFLLIHPPSVFARSSISTPVCMPLSAAYLAANLREHGHQVSVIDALAEGIHHIATSYSPRALYRGLATPEILERIERLPETPQAIGIPTMFSQEWPHIEALIAAIHARFPAIPIIVGGEHATATSEYILASCPGVVAVARGEGEDTVIDFAEYIDGKRPLSDVPGVQFRGADGKPVTNEARPRNRTPDQLPWPAWDLFDLDPYFAIGEGHGVERGRSMPILATRGCPYQCTFCSNPNMWTTRYTMRSVGLVLDEIEHYMKTYSATNIDFFDLTAIIKREWTLDFCREIKRRGLKFTWQLPSGTRSEAMDAEVLEAMAGSGCMNVTYAPESGSEWTLKYIKKMVKLPRLIESIRQSKKNGIFVKCNLVIGFPQETRWDIIQTVWLAVKFAWLGVDDCGLYPFSPYPGSELYAYLRGKGVVGELNTAYFESLMSFMQFKPSYTFCENVGLREIQMYRLVGMSLFYGLSYLLWPKRILRSLRNYREHRSDTIFEERFFGAIRRFRLEKRSAAEKAADAVPVA
jgi:anaerobic magnesium-protoporphyrin IX monomethyl ester cyclase